MASFYPGTTLGQKFADNTPDIASRINTMQYTVIIPSTSNAWHVTLVNEMQALLPKMEGAARPAMQVLLHKFDVTLAHMTATGVGERLWL